MIYQYIEEEAAMNTLKIITSGLAVGGAMTVPGVSGGSAAMVIGIYDRLVRAMSRCFSDPRENLPLLLKFGGGTAAGMLLIARLISFLLTTPAELPLRFLFLGAVAGGVPMIFRSASVKRLTGGNAALILSGAVAVLLLALLPEGLFEPGQGGIVSIILQLLGGALLAAALVLPGISASHFLYILGIYDTVMERLSQLDVLALLPMAVGAAAGMFLTARVLEALIENHRTGTFLVILGFMLGSLRELIPEVSGAVSWTTGLICAAVGFISVYWLQTSLNRREKSGNARKI